MLMPMGFLLPCLHQKFRKLRIIFLIAIMFSAAIEITQYFAGRVVPTKTARKIGRKYMMAYRPEPAQMCIR